MDQSIFRKSTIDDLTSGVDDTVTDRSACGSTSWSGTWADEVDRADLATPHQDLRSEQSSLALGLPRAGPPYDDYFWTEIAGLAREVVGPLPPVGEPIAVEGGVAEGRALLSWTPPDGRSAIVAYGMPKPALRALAEAASSQ